jgi:hypothetical protein
VYQVQVLKEGVWDPASGIGPCRTELAAYHAAIKAFGDATLWYSMVFSHKQATIRVAFVPSLSSSLSQT